ncbi:nitroreductase/quinone reductase family protein [Gordonia sp. VNK21]|uniref:nitroreductase/quinone reductase family protein n=1 Tax=Gordonia sp. VNK21 TaxID=3382483 RepID=UPI0038D4D306
MTAHTAHRGLRRRERALNAVVRGLADLGVSLAGARTLTVRGRRTGAEHRVPVNPLRLGGEQYLVAPRGETDWVRNARAHPQAQLRRGRSVTAVHLAEVTDPEIKLAVIERYLQRWGWEVAGLLPDGITPGDAAPTLRRHLDALPVFHARPGT